MHHGCVDPNCLSKISIAGKWLIFQDHWSPFKRTIGIKSHVGECVRERQCLNYFGEPKPLDPSYHSFRKCSKSPVSFFYNPMASSLRIETFIKRGCQESRVRIRNKKPMTVQKCTMQNFSLPNKYCNDNIICRAMAPERAKFPGPTGTGTVRPQCYMHDHRKDIRQLKIRPNTKFLYLLITRLLLQCELSVSGSALQTGDKLQIIEFRRYRDKVYCFTVNSDQVNTSPEQLLQDEILAFHFLNMLNRWLVLLLLRASMIKCNGHRKSNQCTQFPATVSRSSLASPARQLTSVCEYGQTQLYI